MSGNCEPCCLCESTATGPDSGTPWGICEACACEKCRGFRYFDDRGFQCTGQPFFDKTPCQTCNGEGTRSANPLGPRHEAKEKG